MAIQATAIYRVRPSGSDTNGGGYDAGISGAGTDYSQQDAAQLSLTDGALVHGTTTLTSATGGFTAAMIGNALQLSGTNFTTGVYYITGWTNTNTVTLDRDPTASANGSAGVIKVGGGWATFWINTTVAKAMIVPGNTIYILGTGIPSTSGYATPDYVAVVHTPVAGTTAGGAVTYAADPNTPNYATGGMPLIQVPGLTFNGSSRFVLRKLWLFATGTNNPTLGIVGNGAGGLCIDCVFDQNGRDTVLAGCPCLNCELFSSATKISTNANFGWVGGANSGSTLVGCNVHDLIGPGVKLLSGSESIIGNIIAKNGGDGIDTSGSSATATVAQNIIGNTISGNAGNGITTVQNTISQARIFNNIISNHATGSGINVTNGTAAVNDLVKVFCDYNVFYNNSVNYTAISAGPHDTALGSDPYVASSTENYTLA